MNKREKTEDKAEEFLAKLESERNERLDKIVAMQSDLARKRLKYNLMFSTISLVATTFMVLIGMPLWIGVLSFVGVFLALRHFYLGKLLINKYNEHVDELYKDKDL